MESRLKYTQNDEEEYILRYFGNHIGTLVDIGANDGVTFSNSARLIEMGWTAHLIEPHLGAYTALVNRYADAPLVKTYNRAITSTNGRSKFYNCADSMLSTLHEDQRDYWAGQPFEDGEANCINWPSFQLLSGVKDIDFLSIDAEGEDWSILQQVDLSQVTMLCIEVGNRKSEIMRYCLDAGMRQYHRTFENVIFCK